MNRLLFFSALVVAAPPLSAQAPPSTRPAPAPADSASNARRERVTGYVRSVVSDEVLRGAVIRVGADAQVRQTNEEGCSGQTVPVRHMSLSAQGYRFYLTLNNVSLADGSPFSIPPASLRGNVANLSRPSEPALGYFLAAEVDERSARVP